MTQLLDTELTEDNQLTPKIEKNLSKRDQIEPYFKKFEEWAEKTGALITADTMMAWDEKHNNSKLHKIAGPTKDVLLTGYRTIFQRFLYNYYSWRSVKATTKTKNLTALVTPNVDKASMSLLRRGVLVTKASDEQRQVMIESAMQAFINAAIRLSTLKMPFAKLQLELSKLESHWVN